ncbi:MAG: DUF2064 domain-containing protein [Bdellovibrionales bacterium]
MGCIREKLNYLCGRVPKLQPYWAVVEDEPESRNFFSDYPFLAQAEGGLGDRLYAVDKTLSEKHDVTLFMGADSPQIPFEVLDQVFFQIEDIKNKNGKAPWCFIAPTFDGGFWLLAKNNQLEKKAWTSVKYSSPTTCEELIKQMQSRGFSLSQFSDVQFDVDTYEDLIKVLDQFKEQKPTPCQKEMLEWAMKLD